MEIKFINVSYKEKRKYFLNKINLKIKNNLITGIYGENKELIANLISKVMDYRGSILIDKINLLGYDIKKICYIEKLNKNTFLTKTVSDEFYLRKQNIESKDKVYLNKVISSLKMVGLTEDYLKRDISTMSKSEKRLLEIALCLISNPELIIIDEPYLYLSKDGIFNIRKILKDLKNKYQKTIIILSLNSNLLYELTDELIILKNNQVLTSGKTSRVFKDIEFLEKNDIELPEIILFSKIANKNGIKISTYNTVNELIKGVIDYADKNSKETSRN